VSESVTLDFTAPASEYRKARSHVGFVGGTVRALMLRAALRDEQPDSLTRTTEIR